MRGFGEASSSNFLMLLNGRKLNDLDMGGINFSNIPLSSIDRIEIIRGNSAGTIYGSGAVGGAINIVTKDSSEVSDIINLSYGSYNSMSVDFTTSASLDESTSMMITGKTKETDTYRESGDYDRDDILLRLNHKNNNLKSYLDISSSSKNQLLSGPRVIGGVYAIIYAIYCLQAEPQSTLVVAMKQMRITVTLPKEMTTQMRIAILLLAD